MILTGINPTQIDPGTALGVGNLFPPGIEIDDPRTVTLVGNRIKYVQVNASVASTNAVKLDISVTAANRRFTVISTGAVTDIFEGFANNHTGTAAQFSWIWITVPAVADAARTEPATPAFKFFTPEQKNLNAGVAG